MKLDIKINGKPNSIIVPDNATDQQITDLVNDLNKNTLPLPVPTKPDVGGYFKNLSKIVTEDVPAFNSYVGQGLKRIGDPTITSQIATNPAAKKQGSLAELVSGIPERVVREGGALARVPLGVMGLGMSAGNRLLGGLPGKAFDAYLQTPEAETLSKIGGRLSRTAPGRDIYTASQDPAQAATLGSLADIASLYSPGGIKNMVNVAGKPIEAAGAAYERFGVNKIPSVVKAKPSLWEKEEGKELLEKIKNFSQTIADYNLQSKIDKPAELAAEAKRLADIHNSNADASLAVSSLIGDRKINPSEVLRGVAGDVNKYEIGKFPQYKLAHKKIMSDLKEAGLKEGEQSVTAIKSLKSTLRPGIYGHGGAPNILDAPMADIKKRMVTALNDAAEKAAPEAADFGQNNLQAKKLLNIAEIAKNDEYQKLIKKPGWKEWVAGGGFGVAVPEIARFMSSTKMGSDDAIMGGLIGLGAIGAKKIITSPQVVIPVGRSIKNFGQQLQGITPAIRPGSPSGMKWKAPIMEGPGGSVKDLPGGGREFIIKKGKPGPGPEDLGPKTGPGPEDLGPKTGPGPEDLGPKTGPDPNGSKPGPTNFSFGEKNVIIDAVNRYLDYPPNVTTAEKLLIDKNLNLLDKSLHDQYLHAQKVMSREMTDIELQKKWFSKPYPKPPSKTGGK